MAIIEVSPIVSFRHVYYIDGESIEHAKDEVTMRDSGRDSDAFDETTQSFLGEVISDAREVTIEEAESRFANFEADKDELCSYSLNVRKIDYSEVESEDKSK